jgi:hypothetical protein
LPSTSQAEIRQSLYQAADGLGLVAPGEVIDAEVTVGHAVAQHVAAGPEHGGGDGRERFLRTAPGFEAED